MSTETKNATHTPGPWTISRGAQYDAYAIEAEADTVAHIKYVVQRIPAAPPLSATEANARLIAAAPELLEALRDVLSCCDKDGRIFIPANGSTADLMRAAIAKAEGR